MSDSPRSSPNTEHLAVTDPCVLFALGREAQPFLREFRPHQRFPGAPCWARFCGPSWLTVLVLQTGVGPAQMEKALGWLLGAPHLGDLPYRPKVVLSAGFCGALQAAFKVGDVILATEVLDRKGQSWPVPWPGELPSGEWRPPLQRGKLLTTAQLVNSPEDKQALGQKYQALAVDMESAVVARYCARKEIPFGLVRAVSDPVDSPLSPQLVSLLSGSRVSLPRVLLALARRPSLAPELWTLAKHTRFAARQLGAALGELLTLTLPWTDE